MCLITEHAERKTKSAKRTGSIKTLCCMETKITKKRNHPLDNSSLVDYTGKISNFFEDLLKLDRFAQSVEDEVNRIVSEEEGSRDDT